MERNNWNKYWALVDLYMRNDKDDLLNADRKPKVGDTVYYKTMPSLRGVVTEIKSGIYSVRWHPNNSKSYISFHSEDQLMIK